MGSEPPSVPARLRSEAHVARSLTTFGPSRGRRGPLALQVTIELVVGRHYALALVFITPLVLLMIGTATGSAETLPRAFERVVDTRVGAVVGTVAALAVRLRPD